MYYLQKVLTFFLLLLETYFYIDLYRYYLYINPMKRINIYIGDDQHKKLVTLVRKKGRSGYSEFVRIAIDEYLDKITKPIKEKSLNAVK
ncbi:hypothetical protein BROC_01971 [Candidatus Brocadiaceae bacterium]|nr:hypothetical protein BROC_01971 [Candidatus Brocadiaceae bacterium]